MTKNVNIYRRRLLLDDFFKVEEVELSYERFDGTMSAPVRRLNFERGDAVAAILHNRAAGTVLFVNQFRYPSYAKGPGWITEAMAGMIDKGETPEQAVRRETLEETGHAIESLKHIGTFYVSPGGSSERISLYYAAISKERSSEHALEDEDIQLVELPVAEAFRQMDQGDIVDAKTIIGLMWLRAHL